jgi:hypothetical protein
MSTPAGRPLLVMTRGLPGSHIDVFAASWAAESDRRVKVSGMQIRSMLFGGWRGGGREAEGHVAECVSQLVRALLGRGLHVVVHDTNLDTTRQGIPHMLWCIAMQADADLWVRDLTDTPIEECIARDAAAKADGRPYVGEREIRRLHARFLADQPTPLPAPGIHLARPGSPYARGKSA